MTCPIGGRSQAARMVLMLAAMPQGLRCGRCACDRCAIVGEIAQGGEGLAVWDVGAGGSLGIRHVPFGGGGIRTTRCAAPWTGVDGIPWARQRCLAVCGARPRHCGPVFVGPSANHRIMKKTIIAAAIVLLSPVLMNAQDKPGTSTMDKAWVIMNTEMLNVELGLNDKQKEQVREIDQRFTKKHDAMMSVVPKPTDAEVSEKVEALMMERDDALKAVLNEEQYAKWAKKRHKGTSDLQDKEKTNMSK